MKLLSVSLHNWLFDKLIAATIEDRAPDVTIGGNDNPYMLRWWVIPRNSVFNIYFHYFKRSDDDRALHDHPWWNCSYLLHGTYTEVTIAQGGCERREVLTAGDWKFRSGGFAHRVALTHGDCITLFLTGPKYRAWGFHCPRVGWRPWTPKTNDTPNRFICED